MRLRHLAISASLVFTIVLITSGCGDDSGTSDTGTSDTGTSDTGTSDTGASDTGVTDSGVTDTSVTDSGVTDTGTVDSGPPARSARLVVSDGTGLSVFDVADIARGESPAPDATIALSNAAGLATGGGRLFVGHSTGADVVSVFDDAYALASGATPSGTIPSSVANYVSGSAGHQAMSADANGALWLSEPLGAIQRLADATTGALPTAVAARFTHPFDQLAGSAYDAASDRLYGGQISGAGIVVFDDVSSATGDTESDFGLDPSCAAWSMTVAGGRLYASCTAGSDATRIKIWDDASTLTEATPAADVTLMHDVTGTASGIWGLLVADDTLFAATQSGLRIWNDASAITAPRAPDYTGDAIACDDLAYSADGVLFVRRLDGDVAIFRDATTTPDLFTTLTGFTSGNGITLLE